MPTCFVIMPFGETSASHTREYWLDHFAYFIKPAIEEASDGSRLLGYEAKLSDPAGGGIIGEVFSNLQEADVVLADLTDFRPSVLYELGIRHCLRDRTIMIQERGLPIPFYFQNYKVIRYSKDTPRDLQSFKESVQRRLLDLSQSNIIPWDNPVADYFRGIGQQVLLVSRYGPDIALPTLQGSGISRLFVPSSNAERNVRKEDVILEAAHRIRLLAMTGHSYLAVVGNRFRGALETRLGAGLSAEMVLMNPWSSCAVFLALGEIGKGTLSDMQSLAVEKLDQGCLSGFDPVAFVEQSVYYRHKLPASLEGYCDLRKRFGDRIDLRVVDFEIAATILLTERTGFLEPYINANLQERMRNLMLTFEVEFTDTSYLYPTCEAYFDALWRLSVPYDVFLETQDRSKAQLREKYQWE